MMLMMLMMMMMMCVWEETSGLASSHAPCRLPQQEGNHQPSTSSPSFFDIIIIIFQRYYRHCRHHHNYISTLSSFFFSIPSISGSRLFLTCRSELENCTSLIKERLWLYFLGIFEPDYTWFPEAKDTYFRFAEVNARPQDDV